MGKNVLFKNAAASTGRLKANNYGTKHSGYQSGGTSKRNRRRVDDEFYGLAQDRVKMPREGPKVACKSRKT